MGRVGEMGIDRKRAQGSGPRAQGNSSPHAAIVLAAGLSARLGQPKQALLLDGEDLERRALRLAAETGPEQLLLVRARGDQRPLPTGLKLEPQLVQAPPGGMGVSLRAAARAVADHLKGYLVLSVDLPYLDAAHLQALVSLWRQQPERPVASAYAGAVGIPALLPCSWRDRLRTLDGDQGAREWLRAEPDLVCVRNDMLAVDIDSSEDLHHLG